MKLKKSDIRQICQAGIGWDVITKIAGHKTQSIFTKYNISTEAQEALRQLGAAGGHKAASNMTKKQRVQRAKKAAAARHSKKGSAA